MRVFVRLLEEQAEQALRLAYQSSNKKAERFLRLLAVDLALAAEDQRNRMEERAAAAPVVAAKVVAAKVVTAKPVPVKKTRGLNAEMLRELESLRLIVGPNAHPVEALGALKHPLVNKAAHDLAVLENERNLARANL